VFQRLREEVGFRLRSGDVRHRGAVVLGDARLAADLLPALHRTVRLVVTSPPYFDATNFEEDQWLRLWFLGRGEKPSHGTVSTDDRHRAKDRYWRFVQEAFTGMAPLLAKEATVVVRVGTKGMKFEEVVDGVSEAAGLLAEKVSMVREPIVSSPERRQTSAFRPGTTATVEYDLTYRVKQAASG